MRAGDGACGTAHARGQGQERAPAGRTLLYGLLRGERLRDIRAQALELRHALLAALAQEARLAEGGVDGGREGRAEARRGASHPKLHVRGVALQEELHQRLGALRQLRRRAPRLRLRVGALLQRARAP